MSDVVFTGHGNEDINAVGDVLYGSVSNAAIDMSEDDRKVKYEGERLSRVDALKYEHPEYVKFRLKWQKYVDMYEGNDIYQFIHRHIRESEDMFRGRVARAYYYNYVGSIIDLYIAYIYHSPITRQIDENFFQDLYDNADLQGTKYIQYIQQVAKSAQIFGHVGILVDMPKSPEDGFQTEEERKRANHRPYLTMIDALQILDWENDRYGNFNWVKIEVSRPNDRDWMISIDTTVRYFLIWTKDSWEEWRLFEDTATMTDSGTHPLGQVPLVILQNEKKPKHNWMGISSIRDIVDINIAILNWCSLGDEEIFERCLNVLTMEKGDVQDQAELNHHNILEYPSGTQPPMYLVPGATPLELIEKWIDRAKDQIYRLAKFGGSVGMLETKQATSGIAYAFEFNETNQSLANKAENIEKAEISVHRLWSLWLGESFEDQTITYPDEFGVEDFLMDLQLLLQARTTVSSDTAVKEIEKRILVKYFAASPATLRDKITSEVDSADPRMPEPMPPGGAPIGRNQGGEGPSLPIDGKSEKGPAVPKDEGKGKPGD